MGEFPFTSCYPALDLSKLSIFFLFQHDHYRILSCFSVHFSDYQLSLYPLVYEYSVLSLWVTDFYPNSNFLLVYLFFISSCVFWVLIIITWQISSRSLLACLFTLVMMCFSICKVLIFMATEDEMVGWHCRLDGHEFEQALGVGDGQGKLACCSPWESDTTEQTNWTDWILILSNFPLWAFLVA